VDALSSTSIATFKITTLGILFKLRKSSLASSVSTPSENFEKCQKFERVIAIESSM